MDNEQIISNINLITDELVQHQRNISNTRFTIPEFQELRLKALEVAGQVVKAKIIATNQMIG